MAEQWCEDDPTVVVKTSPGAVPVHVVFGAETRAEVKTHGEPTATLENGTITVEVVGPDAFHSAWAYIRMRGGGRLIEGRPAERYRPFTRHTFSWELN